MRSICANRCEDLLRVKDAPYVSEFTGDSSIYFSKLKYSQKQEDQQKYGVLINKCVNYELQRYGLEAYTEIDYCSTNDTEPVDWLDVLALVVVGVIIAWTLVGTAYDLSVKPEEECPEYFQKDPAGASKLLLAFSVPRNYTSLVTVTKRSVGHLQSSDDERLTNDFAFFEGIRILTMIVNIHVHLWATMASLPSANGDAFERESYEFGFKFSCGATFTNQIYLFFGGFLLTRSAVRDIKKGRKFTFSDLYDDLKKRYWRLTPLYAFMILMEATWIRHMYSGPMWQNYWMEDHGNCRQNWWLNLLYLHNVIDPKYQCILPSKLIQA